MATHTCAAPGCDRVISTELLMCGRHWARVPLSCKRLVWAAWREYEHGRSSARELREAQALAVNALADGAEGWPT